MKRFTCFLIFMFIFTLLGCVDRDKAIERRITIMEEEANMAIQVQNYTLAEEKFNEILKLRPNLQHVQNNLAVMYAVYLDQPYRAIELWQELIEARPGNAEYYNNIAGVYWQMDQLDKALEYYEMAALHHRSYHMPHYNMAQIYLMKQDWRSALDSAEKGYVLILKDSGMISVYVRALLMNEKRQRSYDVLNKALENQPNLPVFNLVLARMYIADGELQKAEQVIDRMLAINPQNPEFLAEKIELLTAMGKPFEDVSQVLMQINALNMTDFSKILESLYRARTAMAESDYDQAMTILNELKNVIPDELAYFRGICLNTIADCYLAQEQLDNVREYRKKAFVFAPERVILSGTDILS